MWIDLFRIHATFGSASASPEAISPAFDQLVAGARRTHLIARVRHLPAYGQLRQNLNSGIPGCGCLVPIANHWIIMRCILATGFLSCWPTWTTLNSTLLSRPNSTEANPTHSGAIRPAFNHRANLILYSAVIESHSRLVDPLVCFPRRMRRQVVMA